eukprot:COSAG02_NODE_10563_length_1913_cov_2.051819_1_plen_236_part_00
MMEENFKPSSWLGILSAGLLWTRLWDSSSFDADVESLIQQIVIQTHDPQGEDALEGLDAMPLGDVKNELSRLLEASGFEPENAQNANAGHARVPSFAPTLPSGILVTPEMETLLSSLLDRTNKRVGFCGMVRTLSVVCLGAIFWLIVRGRLTTTLPYCKRSAGRDWKNCDLNLADQSDQHLSRYAHIACHHVCCKPVDLHSAPVAHCFCTRRMCILQLMTAFKNIVWVTLGMHRL